MASNNFVLFMALALVEYYRDVILENDMDFTDIIKFFNGQLASRETSNLNLPFSFPIMILTEMAERHDATAVLKIARSLVLQIQTLIDTSSN